MRAFALLLLVETAAFADATAPEPARGGPLVMYARVRQGWGAPHCGVLAVESVVRFDVLRVTDGTYAADTVDVGFQCAEFFHLRPGEVRRLTLTPKPRPTSFGWAMFDTRPAGDRPKIWWARRADAVAGFPPDDDRCRKINLADDGCPDPAGYTAADLPDLLDELVREPRLARFRLVGERARVAEMTRWLLDGGVPRGRFVPDGRDGEQGVRFEPAR